MVKQGDFVPDNELWLHAPDVKTTLDEAIAWAAKNPPRETDLEELAKTLFSEDASAAEPILPS